MSNFEIELLNALATNTPHMIYAKDKEGRFTFANQSLAERIGINDANLLLGKTDFDFYPLEDAEEYLAEERQIMQTGAPLFSKEEYVRYSLDNRDCWLLTTKIPIRNANDEVVGIMGINFDITPQKKVEIDLAETKKKIDSTNLALQTTIAELSKEIKERQEIENLLRKQVLYDSLTGLPNRVLLMERLNNVVRHAEKIDAEFVLIFIGLDRLKFINESISHHIGDELLKSASDRIAGCIGSDHILARLAGDEFVLLLPNSSDQDELSNFMRNILDTVAQPSLIEDQEIKTTCSIGCSIYPKNSTDPDVLLKMADAAMRHAKVLGRNRFQFYHSDFNKSIDNKLARLIDLKRAIKEHEFVLYYQPKLELKTNKITSVEALIRWVHPDQGMIPPNLFIPIAEEFGLIGDISDWVIKTAIKQAAQWLDQQIPLNISINLSAYELSDPELITRIDSVLSDFKLPPSLLSIEITESVSMRNPQETIEILQRFKEIGISVSIDDFGTGHSNFAYLHRFPVNTLKIDRSFVNEMDEHKDKNAIIEAMIAMSHKLALEVIAEGVETREQYVLLKKHQCDFIQGYWFAKPMPATECGAFYLDHIKKNICQVK